MDLIEAQTYGTQMIKGNSSPMFVIHCQYGNKGTHATNLTIQALHDASENRLSRLEDKASFLELVSAYTMNYSHRWLYLETLLLEPINF